MDKKWMTAYEVARDLDVHHRTVLRWLAAGEIQANKVGGQWRIPAESFKQFLNKTSNVQVDPDHDPDPGQLRFVVESVDETE